jgi:hypothetical protein
MKLFSGTSVSALAIAAALLLSAAPARATDAIVDAANNICKGGNVADAVSGLTEEQVITAMGEAAGQADAGNCPGVTGAAIETAFGSHSASKLPGAKGNFDAQRARAAAGKGFLAGLFTTDYNGDSSIERTLTGTKPGQSVSIVF